MSSIEHINTMARPTEYLEEFITKVDEYLLANQDSVEVIGLNSKLTVKLPTIEGFSVFINVAKHSLYNWEKKYPEFLHALDLIRIEQKKRLLDSGLSGAYNSTIAKLVLSSNHGMREKTDVNQNISGETTINITRADGSKA